LASKNNSVPQGTVETFGNFPSSLQDVMICGCVSSPESFWGWLISNVPFGTKSALARIGKSLLGMDGEVINGMRKCWTAISAQITVVL
jgi:hypothetical protein